MSIYSAQELRIPQPARTARSGSPFERTIVLPMDVMHERRLGKLTLQLLEGESEDVIAEIDRLIDATLECERPSDVRDLRILRNLAELDAGTAPTASRARAVETALRFALQIVPALKRQITMDVTASSNFDDRHSPVPALTAREIETLNLTARGLSNQEIARELWIAEGTVKKHQSNVLRKLDARNRTEAVAIARRLGVLS